MKLYLFGLYFSLIISNLHGQDAPMTDSLYDEALSNALRKFPRSQKSLFLGTSYNPVRFDTKKGHPFYSTDLPLEGDLIYNNILFKDEEFQYDMMRDEVVFEHLTGQKMILVREKVTSFTIQGHTFKYISDPALEAGFYDLLAESGDVQLLAKREKKMNGNPKVDAPYFSEITRYFLRSKGEFHRVKNATEIIHLLEGNRTISLAVLKKDTESEMIEVVQQHGSN
jgi:hypothetical protein